MVDLNETKRIKVGNFEIGGGNPVALIAGPCVIESREITLEIAKELKTITSRLEVPLIFKASYDKANRSSIDSYRGPGLKTGLSILEEVKNRYEVPILSDVHNVNEVESASRVLDVIQIPAFLCRQTDLVTSVGETGNVVNVKKGQFLAPWEISNVIEKIERTGNNRLLLTERGTSVGYDVFVDFRSFPTMKKFGYPVVFDASHSTKVPEHGGFPRIEGREVIACLARATTAIGIDAIYMEVHSNPDQALCDAPTTYKLKKLPQLLKEIKALDALAKGRKQ